MNFWSNHGCDYKRVSEFLDFDRSELSKLGGVSKQSVRFDDKIPADLRERLEQIANIISLVAEYFEGDSRKTALWFKTPNPMLGEISPRDMIRFGRYQRLSKFVQQARQANEGRDEAR
jgi:uncharacterized protein (DUF2384 family)